MRIAGLLLILLAAPSRAEQHPGGFDSHIVTSVYATALAFMAPRTLEAVPVSDMTLWGLRGLTALDPDLTTELKDRHIRLMLRQQQIAALLLPDGNNPAHWAATAVSLTVTAANASLAVRRAGTQGIIQSFFDELFNHLDPYSRYVPPVDAGEDRARRIGRAGLGVTVVQRNGLVRAGEVLPDSPAAEAGMRPGDILLSVDGQSTHRRTAHAVAERLAGPEGEPVTVSWRGRDGKIRKETMVREPVPPLTVHSVRSADMLVVRITAFADGTGRRLAHALQEGLGGSRPPAGLVLDLRGNRGGLLRQAVISADTLLPAGLVAYAAGRDPDSIHVWRSTEGELAQDMPVVVLVDGRTASAAEILAAALADRGRAVVVGSVTLGKGLVQTIAPLPDGGELFVTWSRVLAPRGWPIQGLGVLPQVCTSLGQESVNQQLASLAAGVNAMTAALETDRNARAPLPPAEIVAIRNTCPAAEGRDTDLEVARTLIMNPASYATALLPPLREPTQSAATPAN